MSYIEVASYIGTIAFALSGIIIGLRKELDVMGVFILAFLTSSGGGVLRDVLLNRKPAVFDNEYIFILIIFTISALKLLRAKDIVDKFEGTFTFRVSDTVGLVAFAISGAETAIIMGANIFTVVVISFLTAVGGGVIRDILVNEVPVILNAGFYASVAVLVGFFLYGLHYLGVPNNIAIPLVFVAGVGVRFYAIKYDLKLPKV